MRSLAQQQQCLRGRVPPRSTAFRPIWVGGASNARSVLLLLRLKGAQAQRLCTCTPGFYGVLCSG